MAVNKLQSLAGTAAALMVAGGVAAAGSTASVSIGGVPAFAVFGATAFAVQWIMFVPAYMRQTEHFFDLTGSVTYVVLVWFAWSIDGDARTSLLACLVTVWAARLGFFLFVRVREAGGDRRFNTIKPDFMQFLMTWTLQGLWVYLTLAPALAAMASRSSEPLGAIAWMGALVWLVGFAIEVIADDQKRRFRSEPGNRDRFIDTGLWRWSQHPNYFGEIVLWCGIALISAPVLKGWQWATLVSPVFVWLLLTRISGIRMLDARARRQWGDDPSFQAYRARTPKLVPRPPRA
jgi:steroid 5-alpha reductase family enzyme